MKSIFRLCNVMVCTCKNELCCTLNIEMADLLPTNDRVDTHHRQRGVRHAGFASRTLTALNGIMEQDWKREMQKQREQNELV